MYIWPVRESHLTCAAASPPTDVLPVIRPASGDQGAGRRLQGAGAGMILLLLLLSVTTGQEVESVKEDGVKEEGMKEEGVKEEGVRARVLARLVELGMAPGDISSLEEVSRVARESACPGVMEDLVTYSLHLEDGLVPAAILLQQVVRRQEVVRSSMEGAPWVVGERRITPSLAGLHKIISFYYLCFFYMKVST